MILLSLEGRLLVTSNLLRGDICMFEGKAEGSHTLSGIPLDLSFPEDT